MRKLSVVMFAVLILIGGVCSADTLFSDKEIEVIYQIGYEWGHVCGRLFQQGVFDGFDGKQMMSRSLREQAGIYAEYLNIPNLLEKLHKEYERGYVEGVNRKDKKYSS